MKTLIIVSHPYPATSRFIRSLKETAESMEQILVGDIESIYGQHMNKVDIRAEQAACENAGRIVLMYPTHWYNLTPNLKMYLNDVWSYGWAYGPGGNALRGKEMMVVTSAGAGEELYSPDGLIDCSMSEILSPMKATALYTGMKYLHPLVFFNAREVTADIRNTFKEKITQ